MKVTTESAMSSLLIVALVYLVSFSYIYWRYRDRLPISKYLSNHTLMLSPVNFVFSFFACGRGRKAVFEPTLVDAPALPREQVVVETR